MIRNLWIVFALTLAAIVCFLSEAAQARPSAGEAFEQEEDMSDALKYLEELDKHYAKLARPSYEIDVGSPSFDLKSSQVGARPAMEGLGGSRFGLGSAMKSFRSSHPSLSKEVADSAMVLLSPLFRPSRRSVTEDQRGSGEIQRRGLDKVKALQMIDSDLAHMSRPRFGKRSGLPEPMLSMYDRYDK